MRPQPAPAAAPGQIFKNLGSTRVSRVLFGVPPKRTPQTDQPLKNWQESMLYALENSDPRHPSSCITFVTNSSTTATGSCSCSSARVATPGHHSFAGPATARPALASSGRRPSWRLPVAVGPWNRPACPGSSPCPSGQPGLFSGPWPGPAFAGRPGFAADPSGPWTAAPANPSCPSTGPDLVLRNPFAGPTASRSGSDSDLFGPASGPCFASGCLSTAAAAAVVASILQAAFG